MSRATRALMVSSLAAAAVLVAPSGAVATTEVVEVGWWTRSPFAGAPEGGVAVGGAFDGPTTVAAIRLDLGRGITSGTLRLTEAGGFAQEVAVIDVCRGNDTWSAEAGGDLQDAPGDQCGADPPDLEKAEDGGEWSIDVKPIVGDANGRVTIMLLPSPDANVAGTVGLGFEVQFESPEFDAKEVAPATTTTAATTTSTTAPPSANTTTTTAAVASTPAPRPTPRTPTAAPRSTIPRSVTTTTASSTTTTTSPDGDFTASAAPVAPGGPDEDRPWSQFGLFVLIATLTGTAAGGTRWLLTEKLR